MIDHYTVLKKLIPKQVRSKLKHIYLKLSLREFQKPQYVEIKKNNFSIKLNPINGAIDQYIYIHKNWEIKIEDILKKELQQGDIFIDVGANIGYFSLLASKLIGSTGKIIAFEPIRRVADQFTESVIYNNSHNILVKNLAAGSSKDVKKLLTGSGGVGGSSLIKKYKSGVSETITVSTLDEELSDIEHIDMIKIDVEGYEYEVLLGAQNILTDHKPKLILEFSPNIYNKIDSKIAESILFLLQKAGYLIYDIENKIYINEIKRYLDQLGIKQTNLFAYHKGSLLRQIKR